MHKPIRCFDGKAQPHEAFWTIRNAAEPGKEAEIELYGMISEFSWFEDDVTPALFRNELNKLNGAPVTLRINSAGGDPIAASVIRAALTEYTGKITARIDGLCASAATIIALAADRIMIQDSAFMMIHDPAVSVFMADLNIEIMQGLLDALKSVKGGLVDQYETRTGISRNRIEKMMSDETWMNASESVKFGFADEVIAGGVVSANSYGNALKNYVNVPGALLNQAEEIPVSNIEQSEDERRLRDEVQLLK